VSYPGSDESNPLNGEGSFAVIQGAIIIGLGGPQTQFLGNIGSVTMGETSGQNAVNPSGTPSGIRLATQNNFRNKKTRRR
jgi:hypothetical protein